MLKRSQVEFPKGNGMETKMNMWFQRYENVILKKMKQQKQ